ncbi:unnamed protein product [Ectocarpus sp. 6 AP-2014]
MRALRALPVLLTCNRISARVEAHKDVRLTARLDQGIPRPAPVLIPAQENQAAVDWEHQPSAAEHLLASMPKAGGAKAKGLLRDTKNKRIRLPPPLDQFNAAERAIAVNAVSWLAVVGGTVLWNRGKMSATEGIVRKALMWSIVSATSVQVASNVIWAVSGKLDGASAQGRGASVWAGLKSFRWSYLGVLAVCNLGEFIQGAYLFRLYSQSSAFGMEQISRLFLAGTLSSMVTGLFAGSLLDRYGRRSGCMLWAILNIVQCFLIRSKAFGALVLGRVIAGAGAMFLATAFESWMITEHRSRGYPSCLLADTFRMATWGIGLATIASGFLADYSVRSMGMGLLGPFNIAIGVSLISLVLIVSLWNENYGDRSSSASRHMKEASRALAIVSDGRLVMMSAVQALFEGVMLAYVVLWAPAIEAAALPDKVALGMVFSTMMVSICGGSSLFKLMTEGLPVGLAVSPEACLVLATGLSTVALVASWMELSPGKLLAMFLVYEACIGLYLPAIATCRSKYIDDRIRGTVMNLTRVPVYVVAAFLMYGPVASSSVSEDDEGVSAFGILAGLMGVATLIQVLLLQREREMGIAYGGSGAMASLPKERRGREGTGSSD